MIDIALNTFFPSITCFDLYFSYFSHLSLPSSHTQTSLFNQYKTFGQDVTLILTYLAQSAHELVPEDVLEPVLMTIANNFVSDRSAPEAMAVG